MKNEKRIETFDLNITKKLALFFYFILHTKINFYFK